MDLYVSVEELRARLAGDQAPAVIDVRDPADYAAAHVPGAINIPADQLAHRLGELPVGKPVVTY